MIKKKIRLSKPHRTRNGFLVRINYINDDNQGIIKQILPLNRSINQRLKLQKTFGKRIRKLRKGKNRNQQDLAKETKLNRCHISEVETGKCNVSLREISIFAKSFNMYSFELLEFRGKIPISYSKEINEENIQKVFGKRIKELRKAKNLTQIELAKRAYLQRSYISKIESGKINISLRNIGRLAKAFNFYIDNLINPNFEIREKKENK